MQCLKCCKRRLYCRCVCRFSIHGGACPSWFRSIARNSAYDHLRKEGGSRPKHVDISELPEPVAPATSPVDDLVREENQRRVSQAVKTLPTKLREVVVLRFFEGTLWYEIVTLNTSTDVVRRRFTGSAADIDLSGVTLDVSGDSLVFSSRAGPPMGMGEEDDARIYTIDLNDRAALPVAVSDGTFATFSR